MKNLTLCVKIKSSSVAEDKGSTKVTTKFSGACEETTYKAFNSDIANLLKNECWKSVNCEHEGVWKISIRDGDHTLLGILNTCKIKNINLNRVNSDMTTTSLSIIHPLNASVQQMLENSVLNPVEIEIVPDMEVYRDPMPLEEPPEPETLEEQQKSVEPSAVSEPDMIFDNNM